MLILAVEVLALLILVLTAWKMGEISVNGIAWVVTGWLGGLAILKALKMTPLELYMIGPTFIIGCLLVLAMLGGEAHVQPPGGFPY
jgi:hypothetical protein